MNILFLTENEISPMQGGTERITHTLSREFLAAGHACSLLYLIPAAEGMEVTEFDSRIKLDLFEDVNGQIERFLTENNIDVAIVNLVRYASKKAILPSLYEVSRKTGTKVVVCFHAMPGEDIVSTSLYNIVYRISHWYDQKQALKDLVNYVVPKSLAKIVFGQKLSAKYRLNVDNCDLFVLLSEEFYKPYCQIAGTSDTCKFRAIPNALSFEENIEDTKLYDKQKRVLIVARMHERSKRLSLAFKIWKRIEQNSALNDWSLDIVGGGQDSKFFRKLIKNAGLKRCNLLGRQPDIESFYENSSIFMMTSAFEGFGITLTEAQQHGLVPVAFDSYASLKDIITSGENGYFIKNGDIEAYAKALESLMINEELRLRMAKAGMQSCLRFEQKEITRKWLEIISEIKD